MPAAPSKFKLDDEISLSGKPMRVAGVLQYEGADGQSVSRYLLADPSGAPVIFEESGDRYSVPRPFPATSQPQTAGNAVIVMGEKYTLVAIRKLKILDAAGQPPGGMPRSPLLVSGVFDGEMGALLREVVPGIGAQTYYSVKPVPAEEILSGAQLAEKRQAERLAAEVLAQAEDDDQDAPKLRRLRKKLMWIAGGVVLAVVLLLGFALTHH